LPARKTSAWRGPSSASIEISSLVAATLAPIRHNHSNVVDAMRSGTLRMVEVEMNDRMKLAGWVGDVRGNVKSTSSR